VKALSLGRELKIAVAVILVAAGALVWWNFYQQTVAPAPVQPTAPRPAVTPTPTAPGAAPAVTARPTEVPAVPFLISPTQPAAAPAVTPAPTAPAAPTPAAPVAPVAAPPRPTTLINPFAPIIVRASAPATPAPVVREIAAPTGVERTIEVPAAALSVPTGVAPATAAAEFGAQVIQATGARSVVPQILTSPFAEASPGITAPAISRLIIEPTAVGPTTALPTTSPAGPTAADATPLSRAFEGPAAGETVVAVGVDTSAGFEITRLIIQPTGTVTTSLTGSVPEVGPSVTPTALATPAVSIQTPAVVGLPTTPTDPAAEPTVATRLEQLVSNLRLTYTGVVFGPINTAIFQSAEGGFAVPLGGTIPGTEVIVQSITAESVTLALETDRAEIDFAR
jgi:hypothetical protein